jgi:hypothetical protein
MGVSLYNQEGYLDPTAHEALTNIERERRKKIVFICSPFAGDLELNTIRARRYGRFAVTKNVVPIIPHLMYPQFLEENDPEERKLGMQMGLELLSKCQELWAFGNQLSTGMAVEVKKAKQWKIPIRYFTTDCRETGEFQLRNEKECFAYRKGRCKILAIEKCQGASCSFLKTEAEAAKGRKKALNRILSLDKETQEWIINKYYKGNIGLLEEGSE